MALIPGAARAVGVALSLVLFLALCACTTLAGGNRLARSSYGCMRAARDKIPTGILDKRAHCLAAGAIALHCSVTEAYMAGMGKEVSDLFTGGDAEWNDLRADWAGVRCARAGRDDSSLATCCEGITPQGNLTGPEANGTGARNR